MPPAKRALWGRCRRGSWIGGRVEAEGKEDLLSFRGGQVVEESVGVRAVRVDHGCDNLGVGSPVSLGNLPDGDVGKALGIGLIDDSCIDLAAANLGQNARHVATKDESVLQMVP